VRSVRKRERDKLRRKRLREEVSFQPRMKDRDRFTADLGSRVEDREELRVESD